MRLVSSNLSEGIAFQIAATRDKKRMTQADLARETGMSQNNISRLESPEYGKMTVKSLTRIAEALDVALVVRFEPFSKYVNWLSGTRFVEDGLSPDALAVASFEDEERLGEFDALDPDRFHAVYGGVPTQNYATAADVEIPKIDPIPESEEEFANQLVMNGTSY